ncbi:MAG: 50S ribosomal protein L6 [Nitrososphaerales archaeon]
MSTKDRSQIKEKEEIIAEMEIPEKVTAKLGGSLLEVNGPKGRVVKDFRKIPVTISIADKKIVIKPYGRRKQDLAVTNTSRSIVRNMIEGVLNGYTYKLKIIFAHFPISINIKDKQIFIENFVGERSPRFVNVIGDCKVIVQGEDLVIKGPSLDDVAQTAANVELGTRVKEKDQRVFLDGLYVYSKEKGM